MEGEERGVRGRREEGKMEDRKERTKGEMEKREGR